MNTKSLVLSALVIGMALSSVACTRVNAGNVGVPFMDINK